MVFLYFLKITKLTITNKVKGVKNYIRCKPKLCYSMFKHYIVLREMLGVFS